MQPSLSLSPRLKTISEMARQYNVSLRTLRFYEDKDLLKPQRIGASRFYGYQEEVRLQLILKGKRFGFALAEIRKMIANGSAAADAAPRLDLPVEVIDEQIVHLEQKRKIVAAAIDELKLAFTN